MADGESGGAAHAKSEAGVSYEAAGLGYFEDRELRRHAGVFYLWALGVAIWYGIAIAYFVVHSRKTLVLSPEEEFAMRHRDEGARAQ